MEVLAGELICIALAKSTARMRHHRNKKIQLSLRSSGLLAQQRHCQTYQYDSWMVPVHMRLIRGTRTQFLNAWLG